VAWETLVPSRLLSSSDDQPDPLSYSALLLGPGWPLGRSRRGVYCSFIPASTGIYLQLRRAYARPREVVNG